MNKRQSRIANREGYDLWSADYDEYPNPTVALDDRCFPPLWRSLTGSRVLEVGCGTGRHTVRLAAQGNQVTGIDLSPGMLAVARAKLHGAPQIVLVQGDFMSLGILGNNTFDALVASLVVEHIRDLPSFFGLVRHLLRDGGEAYLSEVHPGRAAQGFLAHFKTSAGVEFELDSVPHPDGAIEAAAQAAGFAIVSRQDALGDEELSARYPKWARYLGVPMLTMWRLLASKPISDSL
jgi:SAM-dependent methyltransferase